jgi:hypothetical protein
MIKPNFIVISRLACSTWIFKDPYRIPPERPALDRVHSLEGCRSPNLLYRLPPRRNNNRSTLTFFGATFQDYKSRAVLSIFYLTFVNLSLTFRVLRLA